MNIRGITKFTLLDYPKKIACVVFVGKCNFFCSYCHNPFLVVDPESQPLISEEEFFSFLDTRIGKLDAVVISGGEPTLQKKIISFAEKIKKRGFLIKLDTNGTNPDVIEVLYKNKCLDYVGLDYKSTAAKYRYIAGTKDKNVHKKVKKTISNITKFNIDYDVRTTVHKSVLSKSDLKSMRDELDSYGVEEWTLQQYHPTEVMDEALNDLPTYTDNELIVIASEFHKTRVRGLKGTILKGEHNQEL